jgi:hypothetical protein
VGAGRKLAPEDIEQKQNQSNKSLVSKSNSIAKQVSSRIHEFQGDEPVLLIRLPKQYLSCSTLELPIGPFLTSEFRPTTVIFLTCYRISGKPTHGLNRAAGVYRQSVLSAGV